MVLTGSNLHSGSFKLIYDIISGCGTASVGSVYSSYPQEGMIGFPMTVLENVTSSSDPKTFSSNRAMDSTITIPVTCFNKSAKNLDVMSDRIITALEGSLVALNTSGLHNMAISDGGQGTDVQGKNMFHFKTLNVELGFSR